MAPAVHHLVFAAQHNFMASQDHPIISSQALPSIGYALRVIHACPTPPAAACMVHASTGTGGDTGVWQQVCKHWRVRGFCLYGDRCVFRHPPELAAAVEQQEALR